MALYIPAILLWLFYIFILYTTRIELSPFFSLAYMAAISNLKWPIYTGIENQLTPIKLKSMLSCSSDHKDSKDVWFAMSDVW